MNLIPKSSCSRTCLLSFSVLIMLCVSLLTPLSGYGKLAYPQNSPVTEIPRSKWFYRLGNSPVDDRGVPIWTYEGVGSPEWKPAKGTLVPEDTQQKKNLLWMQVRIPEGYWRHPSIVVPPYFQGLEVYKNRQLFYQFGKFKPEASNKYSFLKLHQIPIDGLLPEDVLFLRVYSEDINYLDKSFDKIWLGSQIDMLKAVIKREIDGFILGFLFVFAGLFAVFAYFRRRKQKAYYIISFGAFAICIGANELAGSVITQLFVEQLALLYYVGLTGFISFPIGLYMFNEQIIGPGYKRLLRRIWQLHIIFAVVVLLLDIANIFPMTRFLTWFFGLLIADICVTLPIVIRAALKGNFEAKILNMGGAILMLSGMHDILASFGVIPYWRPLFSWGVFIFIVSLGYILEYRFGAYSRELEAKSRELEESNQRLEEYSLTLEHKVEERTHELREKNNALEQAFQQLRETQNQLVMQARMASLGDLVAGVAHEMNNPIGVIRSSADIASRGIRRVKGLLQNRGARDEADQDEERMKQSLDLVETNHEVIATASNRVASIVRSLRTFARLDEALFKKVDIHQNIDTTIDLVYHELRDKVEIVKQYGDLPLIECYPNELNQMFMNLLRNAIQAIEQRGIITITTYADKTKVYMKISDTGRGISSGDLPRIFDPGFTTQSNGVGKGLGLSIVYNIIQKHHGEITVNSEIGVGTEFNIALPIEQIAR